MSRTPCVQKSAIEEYSMRTTRVCQTHQFPRLIQGVQLKLKAQQICILKADPAAKDSQQAVGLMSHRLEIVQGCQLFTLCKRMVELR